MDYVFQRLAHFFVFFFAVLSVFCPYISVQTVRVSCVWRHWLLYHFREK